MTSDDSSMNYSEGNLRPTPASDYKATRGTIGIPTSGKWYFEARVITGGGGNVQDQMIGVATASNVLTGSSPYPQSFTYGVGYVGSGQINRAGSANQTSLTAFSAGTILGVAVNVDDNEVQFYLNGSAVGTAKQLVSTSEPNFPMFVGATNRSSQFNFGQDSTFAGAISAGGNADVNNNGDFAYAPPSGHLALCTSNLPNPAIDPNSDENPTDHFNTVLYAGTGSTQSITGIFQPDFVWIKARDGAGGGRQHMLFDSIRGATKVLRTNLTNDEATVSTSLTSFNSDGFTIGSDSDVNTNGENFTSWNWKAGGSAVTNNDGSVSSTVSANTKAGFSIVQYEGLASGTQTVGHGLNSTPEIIIWKNKDDTSSWVVYSPVIGTGGFLLVNSNNGTNTSDPTNTFNGTSPTNSVFTVGVNNAVGGNGETIIAYCFHSIDGYSKFGSYNGNATNYPNGLFVYTGFRPALVVIKAYGTTSNWIVTDNKRASAFNGNTARQYWNVTAQETAYTSNRNIELFSNGFMVHGNSASDVANKINQNAGYIYLAFAEQPFKYANAR
tara:strand:- start:27 stop:1688 length:1662 start_codon:yes stop_codon:yes gene_type:complete